MAPLHHITQVARHCNTLLLIDYFALAVVFYLSYRKDGFIYYSYCSFYSFAVLE